MVARWCRDSKVTGDPLPLLFNLFGPYVVRSPSSQVNFFVVFDNAHLDVYKKPYSHPERYNPSGTSVQRPRLSHFRCSSCAALAHWVNESGFSSSMRALAKLGGACKRKPHM